MVILEWKWERITMEFVVGLPRTLRKFEAIWAIVDRLAKSTHFILVLTTYIAKRLAQIYIREIVHLHGVPILPFQTVSLSSHLTFRELFSERWAYRWSLHSFSPTDGRQYRSRWFESGEARLLGKDLVRNALEKVKLIQERLQTAQSRQKSYVDKKVRDVAYMQERVGYVAYRLSLPPSLLGVHHVFHVSMLRSYNEDMSHVLKFSKVKLDENLVYEEELVASLDKRVRKLTSKEITLMKVVSLKSLYPPKRQGLPISGVRSKKIEQYQQQKASLVGGSEKMLAGIIVIRKYRVEGLSLKG
nr:uncharacterized protein LOC104103539 [Nicotiana tomentosiformis]